MERFDSGKFIGGIRHLNRDLGKGIIDKKVLFSHTQTHAQDVQEAIQTKLKERNRRYIEQRRKKQDEADNNDSTLAKSNSLIKVSGDKHISESLNLNIGRQSQISSRSQLRAKLASPNSHIDRNTKPHRSLLLTSSSTMRIRDPIITSNKGAQMFELPISRKNQSLEHSNSSKRLMTTNVSMRATTNDFTLPSPSGLSNSTRSQFFQPSDSRTSRRNGLPHASPFVRELRPKESSLDKKSMRKFLTARRILTVINSSSKDLAFSGQREWFHSGDKTKQAVEDYYRNSLETLEKASEALNNAIQVRKDKTQLDKYLNEVLNYAQKSHNIEFYIAALKVQAKVLIKYKDLYRAITNFKVIKRTCDHNIDFRSPDTATIKNYLLHKLSAYKNLGRCFQDIQNHKMAIFYFVKSLQTAWLLEDRRSELRAYDAIGLQYYYMGQIEDANFYHEKMMNGDMEKQNSDLRALGIQKLKSNIQDRHENRHKAKFKAFKSIEEELVSTSIPASEDEFELPESTKQKLVKEEENRKETFILTKTEERAKLTAFAREQYKFQRNITLRRHINASQLQSKNQNHGSTEAQSIIESFLGQPKPMINISHLSPNRFLRNYHNADPKEIVNAYVSTEKLYGGSGRAIILDRTSLESIRHYLDQFKNNLLLAKIELEKIAEERIHTEIPTNEKTGK